MLDENKELEAKLKKSKISKKEHAAKEAKKMELIARKDSRIADLEKQLAEGNKKLDSLKIENAMLKTQNSKQTKIVRTEAPSSEL